MAVNNSSYAVTDVLMLDAGTNKMAFYKCSVHTFDGEMYFPIYKNPNTGILTSLSILSSSSLITVTNYSHTKLEMQAQINTSSFLVFTLDPHPLTSNTTTSTYFTLTMTPASSFMTFPQKTFSYTGSLPPDVKVEGPCSTTASTFGYTSSEALPSWLTFTSTGATST